MSIPGLRVALFAFVAFATISPAARAGVVNWIGTTGFWDVAGNWNPGIPQAGDSVFINVPGPQLVTFRSPTAITVGSLAVGSAANLDSFAVTGGALAVTGSYTGVADTAISGGTLTLNGGSALNTFSQSNGSLGGTATVAINGTASFTFGDQRGAGTTILNGPATISGSGFRLDGGRTLQNNATLTWSAGQILFNNTFSGASGGPGSGTINNTAGGTFIASGDSATSIAASNFGGIDTGADALFVNAGTFRKSGSSALSVTMIGVAFNYSGTVDAQSGTIQLPDNFHNAGTLTGGGAYTTSTLTNDGHVAPGNGVGNLKLNGNFVQSPVGIVDFEFGTCALFDTLTITGTAVLSGTLHASFQGCAPVAGNTFSLVTAAGISGTFGALVVSGGPPGVAFNLTYTSNSVVLNAVVGIAPPLLNRAVSRKAHGAAGTFDLPL